MSKGTLIMRLTIFLLITSLLLVGCIPPKHYDPDYEQPSTTNMTFGFSDEPLYKDNVIDDKEIDKEYTLYIFITNKNKDMNVNHSNNPYSAENVVVSMIDLTNKKTIYIDTIDIINGYGKIENLSYPHEAQVKFRAEGKIIHNNGGNYWNKRVGYSQPLWIRNTNAQFDQLRIVPNSYTITAGGSIDFKAEARYKEGSWQNVTEQVTWYTSDPSIAVMDINKKNKAIGSGIGDCEIRATYQGITAGANLKVEVPNSALKSITVSPSSAEVFVGQTKAYYAYGHFASLGEDVKINLTNVVTWSSSDTYIATITDTGVATGKSEGQVTITASYKKNTGNDKNTVEGKAGLTVKAAPEPIPDSERLIWEKEVVDD